MHWSAGRTERVSALREQKPARALAAASWCTSKLLSACSLSALKCTKRETSNQVCLVLLGTSPKSLSMMKGKTLHIEIHVPLK